MTPLNCDRDPVRWAREFNEVLLRQGWQGNDRLDEGFLIGWFANAMMCGEDTYRWKQEAPQPESAAQDWVLVPREPTPHMMRAVELSPSNARHVWRAMLAAAPKVKP